MEKRDVMKIIDQISGCDGSDEYARGWDDACEAIRRAVSMDGSRQKEREEY